MITEVKNVRDRGNGEYECTITVNGEEMDFYASPNGGGYCDEVLEKIRNRQYSGIVSVYVPPQKPSSAKRLEALSDKWPDAFALIDDILERGIEAVKTDRAAIKLANPKQDIICLFVIHLLA